MDDSALTRRTVVLQLEQGLHIRVCSLIVSLVTPLDGSLRIHNGDRVADADSMFDLLQLVALPGAELILEASGEDAEVILEKVEALLTGRVDY